MTTFTRRISSIISAFIFAFLSSNAVSLPLTISAGDTVVFNFDFTSETPAPPYSRVNASWNLTGAFYDVEVDSGIITLFDDLDAMGSIFQTDNWSDTGYYSGFSTGGSLIDVLLDGLFSVQFVGVAGNVDLTSISSTADTAGAPSITINGQLSSVPEPSTLALLSIGFIGMGIARKFSKS